MSVPKRNEQPYKNQAFVATSSPSRDSSQSGNNKLSVPPVGPNEPAGPSNSAPSLAPSQVSQVLLYIKDDFKQMFKIILEVQPLTHGQDWRISEDSPEWALKPRALDVYKNKLHIDFYNFIQWYEDYFATSRFWGRNRVFFTATFLNKRALNSWQQYKQKIKAETLVPLT